ncbi:uncharacterized protein EDB93DRAFT_1276356 [Suillus bovinus]|uniref:uncharacterized protein n=1 Tax=Suillus bovinus TaxID=48563 RepID=UPI001B877730|nr:uncharacterized protein EDB93DRAFT_1276356 [Suillus bovinus]KAG2151263.1 hypothetical protein EDB93DRAFT_1276356 [Suillus bovinus]
MSKADFHSRVQANSCQTHTSRDRPVSSQVEPGYLRKLLLCMHFLFFWAASHACTELEAVVTDWTTQLLRLDKAFYNISKVSSGGIIQMSCLRSLMPQLLLLVPLGVIHICLSHISIC